jgi:hypothetical protein
MKGMTTRDCAIAIRQSVGSRRFMAQEVWGIITSPAQLMSMRMHGYLKVVDQENATNKNGRTYRVAVYQLTESQEV